MLENEFKTLFDLDKSCFYDNSISNDLLNKFDLFLLKKIGDKSLNIEVFEVYKKFSQLKNEAPESMKINLFKTIRDFAKSQYSLGNSLEALILYRFLFVKSKLICEDYYYTAEILATLNEFELAKIFIEIYENKEKNKSLLNISVANFLNFKLKDFKSAIKYYEKFIQINPSEDKVYLTLGNLYSKISDDEKYVKKQLEYYKLANKLSPENKSVLQKMAYSYDKLGEKYKALDCYQKVIKNNPTSLDYFNYGASLISCGDFILGHKFLRYRFLAENINLSYPIILENDKKWDLESDISDKILLVHYEQGFGDTFMYCRFVPLLKKFAKKVIFVVQDELFDLIKSSLKISSDIEVLSDKVDLSNVKYDVSMALLDSPFVLKTSIKDIPFCDKYLDVDSEKVLEFNRKFLNPVNCLKIGISCSGDKNANYSQRDVEESFFENLLRLKDVKFYSLQKVSNLKNSNIVNLGSKFSDFTETACAIKNMDLVISTDNVILNLAGALGVRTFGVFNSQANFRWFNLDGENVVWYNSVKPFQKKAFEHYSALENEIIKNIKNSFNI